MLDETKIKAIDMLIENKLTRVEISKSCGKSRQWLYEAVLNNDEAKMEWEKRLQQIQTFGVNVIKSNVQKTIDNIITLANTGESEKIRLDANTYLLDRVLGKTTTKIELDEKPPVNEVNLEEFELEFKKFEAIEDTTNIE